ncbi:DNA sulfur modification protein DndB [Streptomyces sp. NPDC088097]|uniref:DNA sulfur modification protein DndB n=1 Tax=Streptomyces sp. NPDC088097 TaxID=3365823 RepID=UPI0038293113
MDNQTTQYVTELDRGLGDPVRILQLSRTRLMATMPWGQLARIVPDPRRAEQPQAMKYLSTPEREQAEARNEVQRTIKATKKALNAKDYAKYLAAVILGERGERWATPPFALWIQSPLETVQAQSLLGFDTIAYLPYDTTGVLMDAETQHLAHFILRDDPAAYGLTAQQIHARSVGVEIYHGIDLVAARQIFHDRNLLGVVPNKNVALSSDSSNVATSITLDLLESIQVPDPAGNGELVPLGDMVSVRQRQLKAADTEWMTLSTLRSFVITAIFGKAGFEKTSGPISELPEGCTRDVATKEINDLLNRILSTFAAALGDRHNTVIASPAVFAALGAVAHRATSWSKVGYDALTPDDLMKLLADVKWAKSPTYWEGTAGKETSTGAFSLAGGVKDNGSKTAAALGDPTSPRFQWVRYGRPASDLGDPRS